MSREERAIFTNLCLIYDDAGNILVQNRLDPEWPGICFPGGHVKPGEAFVDSVIREVYEETGLAIENPILCGTKQFPTGDGARYVVFFYKTNRYSGTLRSSHEGEMLWIPRSELSNYPLVPDFLSMLEVCESDTLSEFYYYIEDEQWKLKLL